MNMAVIRAEGAIHDQVQDLCGLLLQDGALYTLQVQYVWLNALRYQTKFSSWAVIGALLRAKSTNNRVHHKVETYWALEGSGGIFTSQVHSTR